MHRSDSDCEPIRSKPRLVSATLVGTFGLCVVASIGPALGLEDLRGLLFAIIALSLSAVFLSFVSPEPKWLRVFACASAVTVAVCVILLLSGSWHWYSAKAALGRGDSGGAESHLEQQVRIAAASWVRLPQAGSKPPPRIGGRGIIVCSDTQLYLEEGRLLAELGRKNEAIAQLTAAGEMARREGYRGKALDDILTQVLAEVLRLRS